MQNTPKPSRLMLPVCAPLLALLAACATPTPPPPNAGAVVIAPRVTLPPPPLLVQQTQPKPAGYFQNLLLDYFNDSPAKPTTSTPPMPAAVQTRTP